MPTYEYECSLCQFRFEKRQRFDDEPLTMCPECQGKARRVFHSVPIIFKGGGFYTTDNRKGGTTEPVKGKKELPGKKKEKEEGGGEGSAAASH